MNKMRKIKYNLSEHYYSVFSAVFWIVVVLLPIFLITLFSWFIEGIIIISLTLIGVFALASLICGLIYVCVKSYVIFYEDKIVVKKGKKQPIEIPLAMVVYMRFQDYKWYQWLFKGFNKGGKLSIKFKLDETYSKIESFTIFLSTKKYLINELGYNIELLKTKLELPTA
jgi:hypothetical protein